MIPNSLKKTLALVTCQENQATPRPSLPGIEYRFGLLLALFGTAFVFTLPPVQVPDENGHLLHAYDVAQGHFLPAHDPQGWAGTLVPVNLLPLIDRHTRLWSHPDEKWTRQDIQEMLSLRFSEEQCPASMAHISIYNFFPYLPQAAGIRVARWLNVRPLLVVYAGRLGNLAFGLLCVILALRLTPIGKLLFGAVALLPMNVQQFGSLSADAPATALSLVLVALLLRLALSSEPGRPPIRTLAVLLLLTFAVSLTKFPYTILALLYFGIAPRQIGSRRRYWLTGMLVLVVAAAGVATSFALTGPYVLDPHHILGQPISKNAQTLYILKHPLAYLGVCLNTTAENGVFWVYSLFSLGCLDTPLNLLASTGYLFLLAVLALTDGRPGSELPWRFWFAGVLATFLSFSLIATATYLWWNPLASRSIEGIQGRYFIPLLPMFLLLLRNGGIRATASPRFLGQMTLAVTMIFLSYAWAALVDRFYFHQPPLLLRPSALAGLGLLALLSCWVRYRWLLGRETIETSVAEDCGAASRLNEAA